MPLVSLIFRDWGPDADPLTQGMAQDMNEMWPVWQGYRTTPGLARFVTGLPATCYGAVASSLLGTQIVVGATVNGLYVADSSHVFQPEVTGLTNTQNFWSFDTFGQDLIAVNGVDDPYYYRLSNGSFQVMPGTPPVASIVAVTDNAVILVVPNSQTFYSNLSDTASWVPNIATEVYEITLTQTPGNITGAGRLRAGLVIYKPNAIHFGTFIGGDFGWDLATVSEQVGIAGQGCFVSTGDYHYIWGPDDFWQFDSYNLTRMPNNCKETVFRDLNQGYIQNIKGRYDVQRDLVFWHYPSTATERGLAGKLDSYVCTYLRTGTWGFGRLDIDVPLQGEIADALHTTTTPDPGVVLTDNALWIYDNANTFAPISGCYITSNDFGDRHYFYQARRVRPGFTLYPTPTLAPSPAKLTFLNQYVEGTTPTAIPNSACPISDSGFFDVMNTALLQRLRIDMYGPAQLAQGDVDLWQQGEV